MSVISLSQLGQAIATADCNDAELINGQVSDLGIWVLDGNGSGVTESVRTDIIDTLDTYSQNDIASINGKITDNGGTYEIISSSGGGAPGE